MYEHYFKVLRFFSVYRRIIVMRLGEFKSIVNKSWVIDNVLLFLFLLFYYDVMENVAI